MRRIITLLAIYLPSWSAFGEFVPGRLYVSVNPREGFPDQPNSRVYEFDPQTGQSRVFAEIPDAIDARLNGLCFSPDGSTLFASLYQSNTVAAIGSDGSVTVALTGADGLAGPIGANNLDFDVQGSLYVGNDWSHEILRFPAGGGPVELVTDDADVGPLTVMPTGHVYHAWEGGANVWLADADGSSIAFDTLPGGITSLTSSSTDDLFVSLNRSIYKYTNEDPGSRVLLTSSLSESVRTIVMSPNEATLYVASLSSIYSVSIVDGATTQIGSIIPGYPALPGYGLAVYVPEPGSVTILVMFVLTSRRRS